MSCKNYLYLWKPAFSHVFTLINESINMYFISFHVWGRVKSDAGQPRLHYLRVDWHRHQTEAISRRNFINNNLDNEDNDNITNESLL